MFNINVKRDIHLFFILLGCVLLLGPLYGGITSASKCIYMLQ